jgi:hypothetical protein
LLGSAALAAPAPWPAHPLGRLPAGQITWRDTLMSIGNLARLAAELAAPKQRICPSIQADRTCAAMEHKICAFAFSEIVLV